MFLDFLATAAAAFAAAGIVLVLWRVLKLKLPKWTIPAVAGAAMLGYAIWSEYSWYPRVLGAMPESVAVAATKATSAPWRPWSYAFPVTESFLAIDRAAIRTHPAAPAERIAEVMVITRWQGTVRIPVLFDCEDARRADLIDGAEFDAEGRIANPDWRVLEAGDPLLALACAEA